MLVPFDTLDVVLVEGESDRQAVLATAAKLDRDLDAERVAVVAMGGATNVDKYVRRLRSNAAGPGLVGLCDSPERQYFDSVLPASAIIVCDPDLESELLRAMGLEEMLAFIESQGELRRFRTMQKQPAQRDRSVDEHLHRFCGIRAGRKARYAKSIVEWLPRDRIPLPLTELLALV